MLKDPSGLSMLPFVPTEALPPHAKRFDFRTGRRFQINPGLLNDALKYSQNVHFYRHEFSQLLAEIPAPKIQMADVSVLITELDDGSVNVEEIPSTSATVDA